MVEAAAIAKQIGGQPVKLLWTREDDFHHDHYRREVALPESRSRFVREGRRLARPLRHLRRGRQVRAAVQRSANRVPGALRAELRNAGVADAARRSHLGAARATEQRYSWVFQSFIDELAHAAGKDPVQFRIDLLNAPQLPPPAEGADGFDHARALGVLRAVAERSGWEKRASLPKGRGLGVAFQYAHRGYFAEVADVTVDAMNRVKVNKVWVAADIAARL
jgi:isoquinoline 1-oxidoreductase beta subunit